MHFLGERLILATRHGWRHNLRAVSNVYEDDHGALMVNLVPEGEWYLLALAGRFSDGTVHSKIETHPAAKVFVEVLQAGFSADSTLT